MVHKIWKIDIIISLDKMPVCYVLNLIMILLSVSASAAEPATISLPNTYDNIGKRVTFLEDQHNSLTLKQVMQMDNAGKFVRSSESILNLGNSSSAFWIKIRYKNLGVQAAFLIVDVPNIEHIDFYPANDAGGGGALHSGSLAAANANVLALNHYIFDLLPTGAAQQGKDVYLKVRSNNIMLVALKIADAKTLISHSNYKMGFESVYSGILLMLFMLNVFLFISVKDRTYLYYSVYIGALFVYVVLYLRGYSYIFGPDFRRFVNLYPHIFASLSTIAAFFFSWEFLGIKARVPKLVPVYKLMVGVWIILFITAAFGGKSVLAVLVNYLTFVSCVVAWYAGLCAYRKGLKPALYYLIAWFAMGVSFIVALLGLTRVIPYFDLSYEVGPIGTTIEMLFLSFALGDRYNHIHLEKKRMEKENLQLVMSQNERLEFVVEERTRNLSKANAEKDKLFSIIAHDLRSPFNSLVSILELNDNDMLDLGELKMLLKETRENVDQIHLTLNNLLFWAKGQMAMRGSSPEEFDLHAMVERLLLVYQHFSLSKKIKLITNMSGSRWVFADVNEINLIFRNLIDNAIKFSHENSAIHIIVAQEAEEVKISVCNAAPEMSADKLEAHMNSSNFSSAPRTSNEQGIGLGLHLCREYIHSNGGVMQIDIRNRQVIISFSLPVR
jgi:signal transduction histidine kinase